MIRILPRLVVMIAFLCLVSSRGYGCAWDYDTVQIEAEGSLDVLDAITGRIERYPDLYYEMRLERVSKLAISNPEDLDLYDNAAVACDRLGKSEEAFDWMRKKKVQLEKTEEGEYKNTHLYRYHANLGTVYAHDWIRDGAKAEQLNQIEKAIEHIRAALDINPEAHFGREVFQLYILYWILTQYDEDAEPMTLSTFLFNVPEEYQKYVPRGLDYIDAQNALVGLMVMGGAWESVDVIDAITATLHRTRKSTLAPMAYMRVKELESAGKTTLSPRWNGEEPDFFGPGSGTERITADQAMSNFKSLRKSAIKWADHRESYMIKKLQAGMHPDTHPEFWDEYKEIPRARLYGKIDTFWAGTTFNIIRISLIILFLLLAVVGTRNSIRLRREKKNKLQESMN